MSQTTTKAAHSGERNRTPYLGRAIAPNSRDALELYFRDMERSSLMTADEEYRAAWRVLELRRTYWSKLLGYQPFIGVVLDRIESWTGEHGRELQGVTASNVREDWTAWKLRPTKAKEARLDALLEGLAQALADVDSSCDLADSVAADIEAMAAGRSEGSSLDIRTPRRDSRPFAAYVQGVTRSRLALNRARSEFAHANLRLVVMMAHRYRHNGRMTLADLIQEGNLGLMTAVDRFDPRRGFRFSTYGSWWIRHAISRALSDRGRIVRVPVHMVELQAKLGKARRAFEQAHGRSPELHELAQVTGVPLAKLERSGRVLLEQDEPTVRSSEDGTPGRAQGMDMFANPVPGIEVTLDHAHAQARLHNALEALRPMEADILRMRFGFDQPSKTLREIGEVYGLSRERIRQVQERALARLRKLLQTDGIEEPPDELPDEREVVA